MKSLAVFLCLSTSVWAWNTQDTILEVAYTALLIVDWHQTNEIADRPDLWHEHNPSLGKHPSKAAVNRFMMASMVLHPVVSVLLHTPYRTGWQVASIGLEIGCCAVNIRIGIR